MWHWQLAGAEAEEILRGLNALRPAQGPMPLSPGLGYGGLDFMVAQGGPKQQGQVFKGFVQLGKAVRRDEGRQMERALIETAQPHLPEADYADLHDIFSESL